MELRRRQPAQFIRQVKNLHRFSWIIFLLVVLLCVTIRPAAARPPTSRSYDLDTVNRISIPTGVSDGAMVWGDYDNDGDQDLLASGLSIDNTGKTSLYINNGGNFQEIPPGNNPFEQVQFSSVAWGDYDSDGFLDVLLTGQLRVEGGSNIIGFTGLYHNIPSGGGRSFSLHQQSFPNIYQGSGSFADYNFDGRQDILLTGYTDDGAPFSAIYRNTGDYSGTVFDSSNTPAVTQLGGSSAAWADFDRDGDKDFAISGKNASDAPITEVYRNNGNGGFSVTSLTGLWGGTLNFLDINLDRYLDLLVTGNSGTNVSPYIQPQTILYRYYTTAPYFREVSPSGLPNVWNSTVSVGDYNNDGYPDLAIGGKTLTLLPNQIFRNNRNGMFLNENADLPDAAGTIMAWGDYDGDMTLDLALTGIAVYDPGTGQERYETYIYPNDPPSANTAPTTPAMVSACWTRSTNRLTLTWSNAADPPNSNYSLTYNLRLGTTQGGQEIVNASSNLSTGYHRVPEMGNMGFRQSAILQGLPSDDYYWSVQAIDASYTGGPFDIASVREINLGTDVAVNDLYSVLDSESNVQLNVLGNDLGDGSQLAIYDYDQPQHGTLTAGPANTLLYTPNSPYEGPDVFTYRAIRNGSLYCTRATVSITVTQDYDRPTDITLSNSEVPNGAPSGTYVGYFTSFDSDANQTFTYTLTPEGTNNLDNASFRIEGNRLITNTDMDSTIKDTYYIHVRSTDPQQLFFEKPFTITVIGNSQPQEINLSSATVLEHQVIGTRVGYLSTIDPDPKDTSFDYSLVPLGADNFDNALFSIRNTPTPRLNTNAVLDFGTRQTYQVRIRSTDRGGLSVERNFTITLLPTMPTISTQAALPIVMSEDGIDSYGSPDPFELIMIGQDSGFDENLSWSIAQPASHGEATAARNTSASGEEMDILYTPDANWNSAGGRGNDSFVVRITDSSSSHFTAEITVTVTVLAINDPPIFDAIGNKQYLAGSGTQSIIISGIWPGPLYETGQIVTLTAQCPVNEPCDPEVISNLEMSPVQTDGTAILFFTIGERTGVQTIVIAARDNQPLQNTFSRSFTITVIDGMRTFFPFVSKD